MNSYLIVLPPRSPVTREAVTRAFPDKYEAVADAVWAVASEKRTCADVCDEIGIDGTSGNTGMVVKIDQYYGVFDRALWDNIEEWRTRE